MAVRKVLWTKRANTSFERIIEYIQESFGENVARIFVQRTYTHVERLANFPTMGTIEDENRGIRGFVISKHNTLFYRTTEKEIRVYFKMQVFINCLLKSTAG